MIASYFSGMALTIEQIRAFNQTRNVRNPAYLCYAPALSLNFDQTGNVTACCFNREHVLGRYPQNTVAEIWSGKPVAKLRAALKADKLNLGCWQCERMIEQGNHEGNLIQHFDDYEPLMSKSWLTRANTNVVSKIKAVFFNGREKSVQELPTPLVFEFEISNHCNLECIMCGGKWSSAIRKNREKLPPLKSPYDAAFVEQIKGFLPNLKRANFLGGEPFLINLYYDIWDAIIKENPNIEVGITSNGTMLSSRAKKIIQQLPNCRITLSIDSVQKNTWETIRRNGQFEGLESNIEWLLKSGKLKSFSVCPMIQNWKEIPEILQFCERNDLDLYFNTVIEPLGGRQQGIHIGNATSPALVDEVSLATLPKEQLERIIGFYSEVKVTKKYKGQMLSLISQLNEWANGKNQ